jgi:hypothetical protein
MQRVMGLEETLKIDHAILLSQMSAAGAAKRIEPEYLSVAEAETMTGISRWTWRSYAYKGICASVKVGRRLCLPVSEVRRVMADGTRPRIDSDGSRA